MAKQAYLIEEVETEFVKRWEELIGFIASMANLAAEKAEQFGEDKTAKKADLISKACEHILAHIDEDQLTSAAIVTGNVLQKIIKPQITELLFFRRS